MSSALDAPLSLFSAGPRTRTGPAPYEESEYECLDRAARDYATVTRRTLDTWFGELPEYARASIRNSFRSPQTAVHRGGLFELYLHENFRCLSFEIDTDIGREDPTHRRPDFLLEPDGDRTWVEATAVLGADVFTPAERARVQQAYDLLNRCRDKRFLLLLHVDEPGTTTLGRTQLLVDVEDWLADLDPVALRTAIDAGVDPPERLFTPDDWVITISATPVRADMPLGEDERVLGSTLEGVTELDDVRPLRRNLKRKASHYGELDAPYIVAVACVGTFVEDHDIADALLGDSICFWHPRERRLIPTRKPNGVWHAGKPVNTRLSAVVTIPQLSATGAAMAEPTVWVNPWAKRPLTLDLPWRRQQIADDGRITTHDATTSAREILGLPPNWPSADL